MAKTNSRRRKQNTAITQIPYTGNKSRKSDNTTSRRSTGGLNSSVKTVSIKPNVKAKWKKPSKETVKLVMDIVDTNIQTVLADTDVDIYEQVQNKLTSLRDIFRANITHMRMPELTVESYQTCATASKKIKKNIDKLNKLNNELEKIQSQIEDLEKEKESLKGQICDCTGIDVLDKPEENDSQTISSLQMVIESMISPDDP